MSQSFSKYWRNASSGYTMVELLVVMAILGILAAAMLPLGETLIRSQKERDLRHALWEIRSAIDDYKKAVDRGWIIVKAGESGYPNSLESLARGIPDARPNALGQSLYFLRRVPRDPFAPLQLPAAQTWQLRSYASPPNRPSAGSDVFDVSSTSAQIALDGTKYSDW